MIHPPQAVVLVLVLVVVPSPRRRSVRHRQAGARKARRPQNPTTQQLYSASALPNKHKKSARASQTPNKEAAIGPPGVNTVMPANTKPSSPTTNTRHRTIQSEEGYPAKFTQPPNNKGRPRSGGDSPRQNAYLTHHRPPHIIKRGRKEKENTRRYPIIFKAHEMVLPPAPDDGLCET